jgi:hypothetical protein
MSKTLTVTARALLDAVLSDTEGKASNRSTITANGTESITATAVYTATLTVDNETVSIDLKDDTATFDPLGEGIEFDDIKALWVKNTGETNAVTVGGINNPAIVSGDESINLAARASCLYIDSEGVSVGASGVISLTTTAATTVEIVVIGTKSTE